MVKVHNSKGIANQTGPESCTFFVSSEAAATYGLTYD
jgi:hypothetical protein